ncbi:hypothetical protein [Massilia putida]|uniref:hypothetical protein n=1 Tax=Massilia putida TaxID=1141883 RepID=UPI0012EBD2C0|nr:hypothetical protein [Massilia putida]
MFGNVRDPASPDTAEAAPAKPMSPLAEQAQAFFAGKAGKVSVASAPRAMRRGTPVPQRAAPTRPAVALAPASRSPLPLLPPSPARVKRKWLKKPTSSTTRSTSTRRAADLLRGLYRSAVRGYLPSSNLPLRVKMTDQYKKIARMNSCPWKLMNIASTVAASALSSIIKTLQVWEAAVGSSSCGQLSWRSTALPLLKESYQAVHIHDARFRERRHARRWK